LAVDLLALGAQHDDVGVLDRRVLANLLAHLIAIHTRHHDVEEDDRRAELAHALQPLLAVAGCRHRVALAAQQVAQRAQDVRLVVDEQNGAGRLAYSGALYHDNSSLSAERPLTRPVGAAARPRCRGCSPPAPRSAPP